MARLLLAEILVTLIACARFIECQPTPTERLNQQRREQYEAQQRAAYEQQQQQRRVTTRRLQPPCVIPDSW
jgi:hypothetical protein